ncbi:MAG: hypothetical protein WAM60_25205 [Candidatus Promineifilaceae bacterium]
MDNFYVKQLLGLGDFRVQSVEAVEKWFAIVFLAYTYLQWRFNHAAPSCQLKSVADIIRLHRQEHARQLLQASCEVAIQCQDMARAIHAPTQPASNVANHAFGHRDDRLHA